MLNIINTICRYLLAIVFIFSGFVKLIDPYGTAYKIQDYFETVNIVLPLGVSLFLSIVQAVVEFVLGMNALMKTSYNSTSRWLLAIMSFFTALTLYIAIADPVQDCGCFGDALVITNWQTFFKNLVLLLASIIVFRNRNFKRSRIIEMNQRILTIVFSVFSLLLAIHSIRHLPSIDFRPYSIGTDIKKNMKVPEGMPQDVYETTFIYEKDGLKEQFSQDNYPWQDTTWTYVSSNNELISKGAEAPIHDFVIENQTRGDITEDVLLDDRYTFMLISPQLEKASLRHKEEINDIISYCNENYFPFMVLTSSVGESVNEFKSYFDADVEVYNVDEITLKTMVRAYPGLMIVKDGVIVSKYHHNDLPQFSTTDKPLTSILSHQERRNNQLKVLLLGLVLAGGIFKLAKNKDFTK